MCCGKEKKKSKLEVTEEKKAKEKKLDAESMSVEADEEEEDPDALQTHQVVIAVVMLCVFSLCFATSFFLFTPAMNSLDADFDGFTYTCGIADVVTARNVSCIGYSQGSPCVNVMLDCDGFNETKIMYQYYQNYYSNDQNSSNDGYTQTSYPETAEERELYNNMVFKDAHFYYDRNKPEAMFLEISEPGTNNMLLAKPFAYVVMAVPVVLMLFIGVVLIALFVANKLSSTEISRPVTLITPMHKKVKGKWYLKEPNLSDKPKLNAFEKLQNIKKQQEIMQQNQQQAAPTQ